MTKIAVAQVNVRAGRPDLNYKTMLRYAHQAAEAGADICVFPELALTGSFLGQAWSSPGILHECQRYNQKLIAATTAMGDMAVVFGSIGLMKNQNGVEQPADRLALRQLHDQDRRAESQLRPAHRAAAEAGSPDRAAAGHLVFLPR